MKQFYTTKSGETRQYKSNYKNINNLDALCDLYNDLNNLKPRQVGSLERQTDNCGSRLVKIGNEYGGYFVLKEGTQKELVEYIRAMIKSKETHLRRYVKC